MWQCHKRHSGRDASTVLMGKITGAQEHAGHIPKKHSTRGVGMEDKVGSGDFCGVWGV